MNHNASAIRKVRRLLDDSSSSLTARHVLALCSGGVDSVALVALLAQLPRGAAPKKVTVLWLDHNTGASDTQRDLEQGAARAVAQRFGYELHVEKRSSQASGSAGGKQNNAREWRYETAGRFAKQLGADIVCTGHTASDQLETALLGLIGVTADGSLQAMSVARPLSAQHPAIMLVRPILALSRDEIEATANELALEYREDPTNLDPEVYRRNTIRHTVVPHLLAVDPRAAHSIARIAEQAQARDSALRELAEVFVAQQMNLELDTRALRPFSSAAREAIVAEWLRHFLPVRRDRSRRLIGSVASLVEPDTSTPDAQVSLPGNSCVRRDGYHLRYFPEIPIPLESIK